MPHTFQPGPHEFYAQILDDVSLTVAGTPGSGCGVREGVQSFMEAFTSIRGEELRTVGPLARVVTASCHHEVSGAFWAKSLLETLLRLDGQGVNPFGSTWFYSGHEEYEYGPQESFRFFLVADGRIVEESVSLFFDTLGEEPPGFLRPLTPVTPGDEIWTGQEAEWHASARDWYRQFYRTTHTGRVMVLRSDAPPLYHYKRRRRRRPQ